MFHLRVKIVVKKVFHKVFPSFKALRKNVTGGSVQARPKLFQRPCAKLDQGALYVVDFFLTNQFCAPVHCKAALMDGTGLAQWGKLIATRS